MDVGAKCRVISDYERKDPSELSLKTGDIVEVIRKGKHIWYGKNGDAKGFFPITVIAEIIDQCSNDKTGKASSWAAVTDDEKNGAVQGAGNDGTPKEPEKSSETFKDIEVTSPLEDKRRSRAKSTGRPPSQVFIKENILQRTESMENLSDASEDEENEKREAPSVTSKITTVSQLVMELKQKPTLKPALQKDPHGNDGSNISNEIAASIPAWMKALPKKKVSVPEPNHKPEDSDSVPPWMKEVRKRREHKLSLRSDDELLLKVGHEFRTSQESSVKHSKVEIKSFNETHTTARVVTEEKQNITKSVRLENRETNSDHSSFATATRRISNTYSFTENKGDISAEYPGDNLSKMNALMDAKITKLLPQEETVSHIAVTKVASSTPSNSTADAKNLAQNSQPQHEAEVSIKVSVNSNDSALKCKEKVECATEAHPEEPKLALKEFSEHKKGFLNQDSNEGNKKSNSFTKEALANPAPELKTDKEKVTIALQMLLGKIENFDKEHTARSQKIREDIQKLETAINQQYEDFQIFTQIMKMKLLTLMETKEN